MTRKRIHALDSTVHDSTHVYGCFLPIASHLLCQSSQIGILIPDPPFSRASWDAWYIHQPLNGRPFLQFPEDLWPIAILSHYPTLGGAGCYLSMKVSDMQRMNTDLD